MRQLSPQGEQIVNDLSNRHGFGTDAITHMLFAVLDGNGTMAQFSHPEFAGSGQWMQGGMMMLGDMFNHTLKNRVDALCQDISGILANQPGLLQSGSFQSQSQSGSGYQNQHSGAPMGQSDLFVPDPEQNWWPQDLGAPTATGNQNNVRYAYFAHGNRLAVKTGNQVWVYDTLQHQIGGFSQQQGGGSSITFTSQFGNVDLSSLPVVWRDGQSVSSPPPAAPATTDPTYFAPTTSSNQSPPMTSANGAGSGDVFDALERLGQLRDKGILTDQEFYDKKAELLSRL